VVAVAVAGSELDVPEYSGPRIGDLVTDVVTRSPEFQLAKRLLEVGPQILYGLQAGADPEQPG